EVLEQRIGRLDRIGRKGDVDIHVPYLAGTGHELLARWHHEALDDLGRSLPGASEVLARVERRLRPVLDAASRGGAGEDEVRRLFEETVRERDAVARRLEEGR